MCSLSISALLDESSAACCWLQPFFGPHRSMHAHGEVMEHVGFVAAVLKGFLLCHHQKNAGIIHSRPQPTNINTVLTAARARGGFPDLLAEGSPYIHPGKSGDSGKSTKSSMCNASCAARASCAASCHQGLGESDSGTPARPEVAVRVLLQKPSAKPANLFGPQPIVPSYGLKRWGNTAYLDAACTQGAQPVAGCPPHPQITQTFKAL